MHKITFSESHVGFFHFFTASFYNFKEAQLIFTQACFCHMFVKHTNLAELTCQWQQNESCRLNFRWHINKWYFTSQHNDIWCASAHTSLKYIAFNSICYSPLIALLKGNCMSHTLCRNIKMKQWTLFCLMAHGAIPMQCISVWR